MKKRVIKITIIIIAVVVFLFVWRFRSLDFSNITSLDDEIPSSYYITSTYHGYDRNDVYHIDSNQMEKNMWGDILEILNASAYRQDFRNLLPWNLHDVDGGKNYDGNIVILSLVVGEENDKHILVQFMSSSRIAVSDERRSGFRIYHPANSEMMYELIEYVQMKGEKQ